MAINFVGSQVYFTSSYGPPHEGQVVTHETVQDKIIVACWLTSKIPYVDKAVAYYLYEDVNHPSKSEYLYFPIPGGAGMVLKQHIRKRLGVDDTRSLLTNEVV